MAALTIKDKNSNPTSVLYDANKKTMAVYLPEDIILLQIITRVPPKSVIRFKCVSKQWNEFLMSGSFKEMHNRNHLKDHLIEQKLFFSEKTATFFTIDCESLRNKAPCSRTLPQFEACSPFEHMRILTSYHGLVCLGIRKSNDGRYFSDIIFWNPLTTEYKKLSKPANPDNMGCYHSFESRYGLYYSSCEDDYKLLVVTDQSGNVYIYSLKSDSWRKLNIKAPEKELYWNWGPGFGLSENIYFQFCNRAKGLIKFDTTAERFHKIETPPEFNNNYTLSNTAITLHKGSIHLCVKYDITGRNDLWKSTCIDMWKFNADGDIWSKVVTYQLMPNYDIRCMSPVHLMNNGNWLMINYICRESRICQVDLKKKKYTKEKDGHDSKGKNKSIGNFHDEYELYSSDVRVGCYPEEVIYTETFVSPNQYMK